MLRTENLHKVYVETGAPLAVLKGIDLSIQPGEFVSLIGPSGAGKSTLLHALGGLDVPTQGKVLIDGEDMYRLSDKKRSLVRNAKIGFVFQFYHLLPEFSTLENVMLPAFIHSGLAERKRIEQKALGLLERVGMQNRLGHRPKQLSGGEQQRVAIARALINDPKIVLCDEPTGNLDTRSGENIIALLMQLNKDHGQAIVIVTHDLAIAQRAQRCIHIQDGKITNSY